jgi:hypothetical protein
MGLTTAPTIPPTGYNIANQWFTCPPYASAGSTAINCKFNACSATISVTMCSSTYSGGYCTGDTYLNLYNGNMSYLTGNDDYCGRCSQFTYQNSQGCQQFNLQQSCWSSSACGGTVAIYVNTLGTTPTISPTISLIPYYTEPPISIPINLPTSFPNSQSIPTSTPISQNTPTLRPSTSRPTSSINYVSNMMITTIAGTWYTAAAVNGYGSQARFSNPQGICINPSDSSTLYIMDSSNNLIRTYNTQTTYVSASYSIYEPRQCLFIGNTLYVSYYNNIGTISQSQLNTITGNSYSGYIDGYGTSAFFNYPTQLASSLNSYLFISDSDNYYIRQLNLISTQVISFYYIPAYPTGIAIDSTNSYLYVASYYSDLIIRITISTRVGIVYSGSTPSFLDGSLSTALYHSPLSALSIDGNNNVYITEYADLISNAQLGTVDADYLSGNARLLVTSTNGTTVKVHKTLIEA